MVTLREAAAPPGLRLYAIGDVHGRDDLLAEVHRRIRGDLARRPVPDWRVIHLGDYVDRGPDSRAVLARLMAAAGDGHTECLLGNHDDLLRAFLADPEEADLERWLWNGGEPTFTSFGVAWDEPFRAVADRALRHAIRRRMLEALPGLDAFLEGLPLMRRHGDYLFVHAGLRPGVPLEAQAREDLLWIRDAFLASCEDFGAVVVHGHTPVPRVEPRANRIDIDTGAVFTGRLACLVLEGRERHLLGLEGLEPLE